MVIYKGSDFTIGYYAESVFGTFQDTAVAYTPLVPVNSFKISYEKEVVETKGVGFDYVSSNQYGKSNATFSVEGQMSESLMALLNNLLNGTEQGYSIWAKNITASVNHKVSGCRLSKIKISGSVGEPQKLTIEMKCTLATTGAVSSATLAAPTAVNPLLWTLSGVVPSGSLDATITGYDSWEVDIDYNVQVKHGFGSANPRRIQRTGYGVSGKISTDFEDTNQLADLIAGDQGVLTITLDSGATIGSGYDVLTISGVRYESLDLDVKEWELISMDVPFKGTTAAFG